MKGFKTLIITSRHLKRIAAAAAVTAVIAGLIAMAQSKPAAVPAFSSSAERLLEQGVPSENKSSNIKALISAALGFNADEPQSIIESSSAVFKEQATKEPAHDAIVSETPIVPENDSELPTDNKYAATDALPSHEDIITPKALKLSNATNYTVNLNALCSEESDISLSLNEPEVLIVHTHTTECYAGNEMSGESERTTNESYNMCDIGNIIEKTLNSYGIKTIHDTTIHDYPSYQGSYTRSLDTITKNIEKYPSIRVVLDVHRDAYIYSDGSKLRVAANINGKETAQVMLVLGTDSMGLYHPHWQSNLKLAAKVQNSADIMFPGLMRPINLRRERFNMHVTRGSLLLEIGSNGNTLQEAENAAECIGKALAAALLNG